LATRDPSCGAADRDIVAAVKGSSRALFRTVVVMGAALGCERPATAPAATPSAADPGAAPTGAAPSARAHRAPAVPDDITAPTPARDPATGDISIPAAPDTSARERPPAPVKPAGGCPAGSELPYPPCFYIL
jgi:hypothetical protein